MGHFARQTLGGVLKKNMTQEFKSIAENGLIGCGVLKVITKEHIKIGKEKTDNLRYWAQKQFGLQQPKSCAVILNIKILKQDKKVPSDKDKSV